jgi:hypothetical protein
MPIKRAPDNTVSTCPNYLRISESIIGKRLEAELAGPVFDPTCLAALQSPLPDQLMMHLVRAELCMLIEKTRNEKGWEKMV